jgi:hypothetical protein
MLQAQKSVDGATRSKSITGALVADPISLSEELEQLELPQSLAGHFLRRG